MATTTEAPPEVTTEGDTPTVHSWTLDPAQYEATLAKVERVNARAAKRGFTGRLELTAEQVERRDRGQDGLMRTRVQYKVTVTGAPPSYGGWSMLAAVDAYPPADETATEPLFVLRYAPGVDGTHVDRSTLRFGWCDHCRTTKRNRVYTYLVREDSTGQLMQVGKTCLRDFLGWNGNPVFVTAADAEDEADTAGGGGFADHGYPPVEIVAVAWAMVREFGWVSAREHWNEPTRDRVTTYLYGNSKADKEFQAEMRHKVEQGQAHAAEIVQFLQGHMDDGPYGLNLKTALSAAWVDGKAMGLVCSAVAAYDRALGQLVRKRDREEAERQRRAARNPQHQGEVGGKVTVTGTVTKLMWLAGDWGPKALVVLEGPEVTAKTFTTAKWADQVKVGDAVTLHGTVKKHTTYWDEPQTELTRAKLTDHTPAPEQEGETA